MTSSYLLILPLLWETLLEYDVKADLFFLPEHLGDEKYNYKDNLGRRSHSELFAFRD